MTDFKLVTKDVILSSSVILLIVSLGINLTDLVDQTPPWYYCEMENTLQQCESLTSYGVPDAKCIIANPEIVGASSDICTKDGVRQAWKPISDYVNIIPEKGDILVESIQNCYNVSYKEIETVYEIVEDNVFNKTTQLYTVVNVSYTYDEVIIKQRTICNPEGYNVYLSSGFNYSIKGDCCGYFEESPYKEFIGKKVISCREKVKNICNPIIQQTSNDLSEYDELGRIYVLEEEVIEQTLVGETDWVLDNNIKISSIAVLK